MSEIQNLMNDLRAGRINRREFIGQSLAMGVSLSGIAMLLQSCGGGGGSAANPPIKWSTWGNAGEIQRFQEFTKKYNTDHKANVTLIPVPSSVNYVQKILTELNGGVAPDLFYAGDGDIIKFVQNKTIVELTALLGSSKSHSKVDEYLPGLWGASKTKSGKIYGVPVDCNPLVLWYNKKVLQDAGVTDDPATLASQGQWTRDKFEEIINKVHAKGKYGYVLDDWTLPVYSWITPQGGTVYDEDGYGQFVAQDDAKAVEAFQWLAKGMQSKTLTFAGTLPKGTGADLAFISNQVAFVSAGRWYLPEFKVAKGLEYDIVPFPSSTGKMEPAGVALAYMVINNKTKYQDAAFEFLTNFVSKEGQTFRLQGGGNAVPSIKGPDQLVLEGNLPAHAQTFLDARNAGYALFPAEMGTPGLSDDIKTTFQNIWLKNADVKDTLGKISAMANPRIKDAQSKVQ